MEFKRQVEIRCQPVEAFHFLRDKHRTRHQEDSPVLVLDKITPGPVGLGTQYYEVVQMFPWMKGAIWSEITRFEPPHFLEERFWGTGMQGHLAYEFRPLREATLLIQHEQLNLVGLLRLFDPFIARLLLPRIELRLDHIRMALEAQIE